MPSSRESSQPKAPKLELSIFSGGRARLCDLVRSPAQIPEKLQGGIFKANLLVILVPKSL